jgi:hypothetical protein
MNNKTTAVKETLANEQLAGQADGDGPLTVEVPSEIRAGVRTIAARTSCSPYSSCYNLLA